MIQPGMLVFNTFSLADRLFDCMVLLVGVLILLLRGYAIDGIGDTCSGCGFALVEIVVDDWKGLMLLHVGSNENIHI